MLRGASMTLNLPGNVISPGVEVYNFDTLDDEKMAIRLAQADMRSLAAPKPIPPPTLP